MKSRIYRVAPSALDKYVVQWSFSHKGGAVARLWYSETRSQSVGFLFCNSVISVPEEYDTKEEAIKCMEKYVAYWEGVDKRRSEIKERKSRGGEYYYAN